MIVLWRIVVLVACVGGCAHRAARFDPRARPTCLVLSVGGAAGVAHLGAIAATKDARLPIQCVVGNSMGALAGGLYASAPAGDTEARFRAFVAAYTDATARDKVERGLTVGSVLAGLAALFTGGVVAPALAFVSGAVLGAEATPTLEHERLVHVLDQFTSGVSIEALPVRFATFYQQVGPTGVVMKAAVRGKLAQAVGGSVANPLIFPALAVAEGGRLDPGADRVAAVPVEDACRLFPGVNLLVINVSGQPAFFSRAMTCPYREVIIDPGPVSSEQVFTLQHEYRRLVQLGRERTRAALAR